VVYRTLVWSRLQLAGAHGDVKGQYGYYDQIGAREIAKNTQDAAAEEAQVLSTMATYANLAQEGTPRGGSPFSAVENAQRPEAFDWVEQLMDDNKLQSHDYKSALQRLHLKSASHRRLRGMTQSTWPYWW